MFEGRFVVAIAFILYQSILDFSPLEILVIVPVKHQLWWSCSSKPANSLIANVGEISVEFCQSNILQLPWDLGHVHTCSTLNGFPLHWKDWHWTHTSSTSRLRRDQQKVLVSKLRFRPIASWFQFSCFISWQFDIHSTMWYFFFFWVAFCWLITLNKIRE